MFSKRHKQQKKHNQKHNHQKTTQQEESPEKKKKNKKTTTNNKKRTHKIKTLDFLSFCFCFLFVFFVVVLLHCVFCFFMLFFSCFWFSSLILFVCSVAFYLFIQLYIICAVGLITQDIWTLLRHQKSKCQDMSRWLCVLAKLENVFLTTFDCSWRCNHCQSARYPGKKYKFFAGERRYSHWYQKTKGLKYPSKN